MCKRVELYKTQLSCEIFRHLLEFDSSNFLEFAGIFELWWAGTSNQTFWKLTIIVSDGRKISRHCPFYEQMFSRRKKTPNNYCILLKAPNNYILLKEFSIIDNNMCVNWLCYRRFWLGITKFFAEKKNCANIKRPYRLLK